MARVSRREGGSEGAARTIRFYETIGWIGKPVDDCLQTMLNGFDGGPDVEDPEPRSSLGVDHKRSLWRISQISTPAKKRRSFDEWLEEEGISTRKTIEIQGTGDSDESDTEEVDATAGPADPEPADPEPADETSGSGDLESETELSFTETIADGPKKADTDESTDDSATAVGSDDDSTTAVGSDDDSDNAVNVAVTDAESESGGDDDYGQIAHDEWIVDDDVEADREMVWVDSDVMETESGTKLHEGYYGYDSHDDYAKPILVPEEQTDLEPWQVEFINSVLISDETDYE
nr:FlaD/FlaE family flagellar protein [Natronobacterium gregoryi]